MLRAGIVGLPNVGKSTLFNAMTKAEAVATSYMFSTIEPNIGVVSVKDDRLAVLKDIYNPKKVTPTTFEFTDIAGLVSGASMGEGLGNQFLSQIREVDAICQVVRCFEDKSVAHVDNSVDPVRDIETIKLELFMADMQLIDRRLERLEKKVKAKVKEAILEQSVLKRIKDAMEEGGNPQTIDFDDEELKLIRSFNLLVLKPMIIVANIGEDDLSDISQNPFHEALETYAKNESVDIVYISAKVEAEIASLSDEEQTTFLDAYGMKKSGLDVLIEKSYALLGLKTFFTAGDPEVRAWTFREGMKAPECAGTIHSDFERGFIKAETLAFDDLVTYGTPLKAREHGKVRLEGKEYHVKDGDIIHFRFNV
jgi:ribosome-binding ATPase